jgi:hypothetical protein
MSILLQDLQYGIRLLVGTLAFTIAAALSLALGIAANTTILTLVNAVLPNPPLRSRRAACRHARDQNRSNGRSEVRMKFAISDLEIPIGA